MMRVTALSFDTEYFKTTPAFNPHFADGARPAKHINDDISGQITFSA
jgi:hypothetical protein